MSTILLFLIALHFTFMVMLQNTEAPHLVFITIKKIMFDGWQGTINWKHTCADKQTISDMICCESYTF